MVKVTLLRRTKHLLPFQMHQLPPARAMQAVNKILQFLTEDAG